MHGNRSDRHAIRDNKNLRDISTNYNYLNRNKMENLAFTFAILKNARTFVVRKSFLQNSYVFFYVHTAYILNTYRRSYTRVFICHIAVKRFSQTGVCFSFFFYSDNFISCENQMKVIWTGIIVPYKLRQLTKRASYFRSTCITDHC